MLLTRCFIAETCTCLCDLIQIVSVMSLLDFLLAVSVRCTINYFSGIAEKKIQRIYLEMHIGILTVKL